MIPEILAPAGSMEALKAAVHAGADAVYLGGRRFGARAFASNFDEEALIQAIQYAHLYGVKVYLTVNTLFRNEEIEELSDYLLPFYQAGLDAVIVQDLGVLYYIHQNFPKLPIHASTQMTITTEYAYTLLKDYGVTRIVPVRELSIEEIKNLKKGTEIPEIEVFVQGALCYCYSGQCLMSSILGGRSGNRGRCAQTCRLPYTAYDRRGKQIKAEGEYLLSPKDLCALEAVPDLIRAGVDSFKIEGRMKKPEYVAACIRAYRGAVDAWYQQGALEKDIINRYQSEIAAVFNRGGFTKGYFYQENGKDMMSVENSGNTGVIIGKISDIRKNQIRIQLEQNLFKGDILVLEGKKESITLTSNVEGEKGMVIPLNSPKTQELSIGQKVTRMYQSPLMEELETYSNTDKLIPLWGRMILKTGSPAKLLLRIMVKNKEYSVTQTGRIVEKAGNRPLSAEVISDKVKKTGDTRYYFEELQIDVSEDAFYSLKELKELRRSAIKALEEEVTAKNWRNPPAFDADIAQKANTIVKISKTETEHTEQKIKEEDVKQRDAVISVMVSNPEQYEYIKQQKRIQIIYLDLQYFKKDDIIRIMSEGENCYIALPVILRKKSFEEITELPLHKANGILVRNIDELAYLNHIGYCGKIVTDYSLYIMNNHAAEFVRKIFSDVMITIPVELNRKQIKQLGFLGEKSEIEVYGYQQLMVSVQCLQKTLRGCNHCNDTFYMKDRLGKSFFAASICKYCYNLIYNGVPTILFDLEGMGISGNFNQRIHFIQEDITEIKRILDAFFQGKTPEGDRTRGHYNRGVE